MTMTRVLKTNAVINFKELESKSSTIPKELNTRCKVSKGFKLCDAQLIISM